MYLTSGEVRTSTQLGEDKMTKLKVQLYWKNNTPMNNKIGTQYYDLWYHPNLISILQS